MEQREAVKELRMNLAEPDLIKARSVIASWLEHDWDSRRLVFELTRADEDVAVPMLAYIAAQSGKLDLVAPVLETKVTDAGYLITEALSIMSLEEIELIIPILQDNPSPRLIYGLCNAVGQVDAARRDALLRVALEGEHSLFIALYFALHNHIEAAEEALKDSYTAENLVVLANDVGRDQHLDVILLDLLTEGVKHLDNQTLVALVASPNTELRVRARALLIERGEDVLPQLYTVLEENKDKDHVILTLNILGQVGGEDTVKNIRAYLHKRPADANARFAAYEALADLPLLREPYALAAGLEDPDDSVRLAVMRAIDRNLNDRLTSGLINIVAAGNSAALDAVKLVLEGACKDVFRALVDQPFFQKIALSMLATRVHPETKIQFSNLLREMDKKDLADGLTAGEDKAKAEGTLVYAVDDSRMILMIYKSLLHNLGCEVRTYLGPDEAVAAVQEQKPDFIFTDLNMEGATGLDLARKLRLTYTKTELPIYLVTTQGESDDQRSAKDELLNGIINKPFREEDLKTAMESQGG